MRKLIYAINITLDGCCDHTKQMVLMKKYSNTMRCSCEMPTYSSTGVKPIN